jgi:hypothetical protein
MAGFIHSCPHCNDFWGASFLGLSDGLGSDIFECVKCQGHFHTGKQEWSQMGILRRIWFGIASLLQAAGLGFAGGLVGAATQLRWGETSVRPEGAFFWGSASAVFGLVLLIQLLRIYWSIRRVHGKGPPYVRTRFFSFQTNLQFLFAMVILLVAIGSVGFSFYRDMKERGHSIRHVLGV